MDSSYLTEKIAQLQLLRSQYNKNLETFKLNYDMLKSDLAEFDHKLKVTAEQFHQLSGNEQVATTSSITTQPQLYLMAS